MGGEVWQDFGHGKQRLTRTRKEEAEEAGSQGPSREARSTSGCNHSAEAGHQSLTETDSSLPDWLPGAQSLAGSTPTRGILRAVPSSCLSILLPGALPDLLGRTSGRTRFLSWRHLPPTRTSRWSRFRSPVHHAPRLHDSFVGH